MHIRLENLRLWSGRLLLYLTLIAIAFVMMAPFLWTLSTSLKSGNIFTYPPEFIPKNPTFKNYVQAWTSVPFGRYFFNSTVVTCSVVLLNLVICSLAAYALAWMEFRGSRTIFILILSTLMIPTEVAMVPIYLMLKKLGWLNSYVGLIVPFGATGFNIFLFRQFFRTLPKQLGEAARIDGCNSFGVYARIVLPISKPVIASVAIFTFVWSWNVLLWPLIITTSPEMATLPLGLARMQSVFASTWANVAAGSVLSIIPTVVFFLLLQRFFIKGLTAGAVKG